MALTAASSFPAAARTAAAPLTIARVDAIPVALPLKKPVVMAGERIERSQSLLVRVEAANGLVGWGEASAAPLMTGDMLPGMVAAVADHLAPLVHGQDALNRAGLAARCAGALLHNTGAKCALNMALNDLVGRHFGVSLCDLFGGALRDDAEPMYLLGNPKVEDDIAEAAGKLKEGWTFFKVAESSLGAAAIVQLACLAPNLNWGLSITNHYLAEDLAVTPLRIERGRVARPRGPGLGVEVSEEQVRRFRVG